MTTANAGYSTPPTVIMRFPGLSVGSRLLYVLLLSRTNPRRDECYQTWVGNKVLTKEMGVGCSTIKRYLAELVRAKVITVESSPRSRLVTLSPNYDGVNSSPWEK